MERLQSHGHVAGLAAALKSDLGTGIPGTEEDLAVWAAADSFLALLPFRILATLPDHP